MKLNITKVVLFLALFPLQANAGDVEVKITKQIAYSTIRHGAELVKVQRNQDKDNIINEVLQNFTSMPTICVNPISIVDGVATVAELEVIEFMETTYSDGNGVIIDVREPAWYKQGTIPGSINIPFIVFENSTDDPELVEVLEGLGVRERGKVGAIQSAIESLGFFNGDMKTDQWDFSEAKELVIWCNGPWCGQSPDAVRALVTLGYPVEKIKYYRGGMQMWLSLGLTTVLPAANNIASY